MAQHVIEVSVSTEVAAPPSTVFGVYADYRTWPWLFTLVRGVRLVRREGQSLVLDVDHVDGHVVNELELAPPHELRLWEDKPHYVALFVNRFTAVPAGTRFTATGYIVLKGAARLLWPLLRGVVRRRMLRFQLHPVKAAAETRAAAQRWVEPESSPPERTPERIPERWGPPERHT